MKLISWNVNGLRACLNKGFMDYFQSVDADAVCLQETKMQPDQAEIILPGYRQYWNSAEKKGYSGTAVFTRMEPLWVGYDIGDPEHSGEGRSITLEFEDFYLVTVYTPNSQRDLVRIEYRMRWEDAFRAYLKQLDAKKPVIVCGDMNVAHNEIDLKNPKTNVGNAGFSFEEREKMTELLAAGFTDTFRYLHPEETGAYTWWSYMFKAREKNAGWRIDYFLVSDSLRDQVKASNIHSEVMGSDHCPVELILSTENTQIGEKECN
ncbi:exodeoxyribonuclease III [Caproiciproducens faecalis]|uniref:Exodeoxyribonuclease III n=1 Tax=Caproiciproducens faecalis TaxID=2820301 RepID=A0ABS7DR64_9FIRM|nr:exodeoxyribonuclease III [Caproiciproducens faecalis]MBW7573789.1 exodeoxyribonuclease III [Caproiciproducens faecalis]